MPIVIEDPELERLVEEGARRDGVTPVEAIRRAFGRPSLPERTVPREELDPKAWVEDLHRRYPDLARAKPMTKDEIEEILGYND